MEFISILLTTHAILFLISVFFKTPITTLQCGLYGFSGKPRLNKQDMRLVLAKFKILGMYNESRGKDSCGVVINNLVTKGTGPKKLFTSFIQDTIFETNPKNRIILGHNRSASSGFQANEKNQHPFLIEDDLLLTHNGTLKETYSFCKLYDVPYAKLDVDSEMLAHALFNHGTKVLETYKGMAALAYTFKSKPNFLYLYHGASKLFKAGKEMEERPLFYMHTKEGIYYSSIAEALSAIRENDEEEPYVLPYNIVVEIVDGEFTENDVTIERGDINLEIPKEQGKIAGFSGSAYNAYNNHTHRTYQQTFPAATSKKNYKNANEIEILTIRKESLPKRVIEDVYSDYMYFYRGRHYCHYTENGTVLANGPYILSPKKGYILTEESEGTFIKYYYKGVVLKDKTAYDAVKDLEKNTYNIFEDVNADWGLELSKYAEQPVYAHEGEGRITYRWYLDSKVYDGVYLPLFSGRSYNIKEGYLRDIKSSHKEEVCYYGEIDLAEKERTTYLSGGLIKSLIPVQITSVFHSNEKTPFYLKVFKTKKELISSFGPLEYLAIDYYLRWFLDNDVAWAVNENDILLFRETMMDEMISDYKSLKEWINDEDGVQELIKEFKRLLLEEDTQKNEGQITYPDINDDDNIEDATFEEVSNEDSNELVEIIESILDNFSELHDNANELQLLDIVSAQSMSCHLYSMVDNFRSNCENDKDLKNNADFKQFINNIKELKNGVI